MAMTPKSFKQKKTTRKGEFAEHLVRRRLEADGYMIMGNLTEGAHAFDFLAFKGKEMSFAFDVKSKAERKYYPDTGIDTRHLDVYQQVANKHNIEFRLFFVDEENKKIYGNSLQKLVATKVVENTKRPNMPCAPYPWKMNGITYFPIASMQYLSDMTNDEAEALRKLTTKNQAYIPKNITKQPVKTLNELLQ